MSAVIIPTTAPAQLAAAADAASHLVLQPGTVVDAHVLASRENLARILIAGLAIEVLTEVALQPGANLKLAVSQTTEGVRLAIVTPEAASAPPAAQRQSGSVAVSLSAPAQGPGASGASQAASRPEAIAIAQAVQTSAPKQASLAPLFANLPVIVTAKAVPPQVQSAASQLLATRAPLDNALTGNDLRQAFQNSGLFLEATLARGAVPRAPDLKAALAVFRHVVSNWLNQPGSEPGRAMNSPAVISQSTLETLPQRPVPIAAPAPRHAIGGGVSPLPAAVVPGSGSVDAGDFPAQSVLHAAVASHEAPACGSASFVPVSAENPELPAGIARTTAHVLLREPSSPLLRMAALQGGDEGSGRADPQPPLTSPLARVQPSETAPPFRGGLPTPQPVASPSLVPDAPSASMGQQLLEQTEAALARQTLLQVASLPDRTDLGGTNQNVQARWSFEIPFATPQGTAVAQFEIERDGGSAVEAAAPSRVWRARFTLDIEPAGPVHALVSLIGDKTAVRMWAERPETAAGLRAGTNALSEALRRAELEPGDILVADGAPPQPKMRTGHFLDRAT